MKNLNKFSASLMAFTTLAMAPAAMAQAHVRAASESSDSNNQTEEHQSQSESKFCTVFAVQGDKFKSEMGRKIEDLQGEFDGEKHKVASNHDNEDKTLEHDRSKWSNDRSKTYAKLDAKATTDAQKQAVATFKTSIEAAVTARQTAIDAARAAYAQGLTQLAATHAASVKDVLTAYQTSVQAAVAQAKADCAAGKDPATVRQTLMTALESAKKTRNASSQQVDRIGAQVKVLVQTRNAAIQKAINAYQAAVKAAVAALKAAFPEQQSTTPPPTNTTTTTPTTGDTTIQSHE